MRNVTKSLNELTATEIVAATTTGKVTCEAVARACSQRIEEREALVGAWQYFDPRTFVESAKALDRGTRRGSLFGVPFGIKDIIDTAEMPTENGTPIHAGRRPARDASCVALGKKAGGVLAGKTVTTEFANFFPGKTRNPLDPSRTPGGSSSGSAAAVADFMVPLAVGTQTTGSTIRPASFCGIFGYRPTYGEIRCSGVMESSGSLDTVGLLARSIDDIALYRDVLLDIEPVPVARNEAAPRIGLCRTPVWPVVEASTAALIENSASDLARAGASVVEIDLPASFDGLFDAHRWISSFEFVRNQAWEIENHWSLISETLRNGRIKDGLSCTLEAYREAKRLADECREELDAIFDRCDILITPAATGEAPVGLQSTGNASPCAIWTAMYVPAISVPVFTGPNGLPIGLQVVAKRQADRDLFAHADWVFRQLT